MISDATDDNCANSPEHLQHLGGRSSELNWCNLTAVCRCVRNEDAPWNALKELGQEHDGKRVGEVEHKDESIQEHEASDGRPAVTNAAREGTSQTDTNDGTDWASHLKRRLPASHDDELALFLVVYTIFVGESGQSDEVTHEENTVGFHDLTMMLDSILHINSCA
jgi:hypothetical protein